MTVLLCRPTFLQLVETLTQIEIEFRRECRRQRPAMWGAAGGTPARRKSTGLGGIPIPHTHKPPSRFGSNVEKTNAESFSVAASPLMSTEVELGVDDSPIMTPRGR